MADYIDRQYAIEHYQHVCRRTNCKECPLHIQVTDTLTDCELELFLHNLPSADEYAIVKEYCRKRNLVIITREFKEFCKQHGRS